MHYLSIIRFLEFCDIDTSESGQINVSQLKKRVHAEFALQYNGLIEIEGMVYSKQEVLQELEHPECSRRLMYHHIIWREKTLLALLEKSVLDLEHTPWTYLQQDTDFIAFISPYFATAFNASIKRFYQIGDLENAGLWMEFSHFIQPQDYDQAFESTRVFFKDTVRLFKNLNHANFKSKEYSLALWAEQYWAPVFNFLPDYYTSYADDVARSMIAFTVEIQNNDNALCRDLTSQMLSMNSISPEIRHVIINNYRVFDRKHHTGGSSSGGRSFTIFYIAVVVVLILVKVLVSVSA